jgi:ppGpp synthetase/RelA/SpoT-type nucleotidyltranferase
MKQKFKILLSNLEIIEVVGEPLEIGGVKMFSNLDWDPFLSSYYTTISDLKTGIKVCEDRSPRYAKEVATFRVMSGAYEKAVDKIKKKLIKKGVKFPIND